mgnify:CR=1 FL=1
MRDSTVENYVQEVVQAEMLMDLPSDNAAHLNAYSDAREGTLHTVFFLLNSKVPADRWPEYFGNLAKPKNVVCSSDVGPVAVLCFGFTHSSAVMFWWSCVLRRHITEWEIRKVPMFEVMH